MSWFQQNRWLGTFLIIVGVGTLGALYFIWSAKGSADEALAQFNDAANERRRLESLDPFPNEANYRKMKGFLDHYAAALDKLKEDLRTRVLPAPPIAPNEFQSRLRQAMLSVAERARNNKVKLPDNFALGFDEYTAALPNTAVAPLLGQELSQIELLMNILIDARVDSINRLTRSPLPEEKTAAAAPTPAAAGKKPPAAGAAAPGSKPVERGVVEVALSTTPGAGRKALNQIGTSTQQLFIPRTVYFHNLNDKGPPREAAGAAAAGASPAPSPGKAASNTAINFIVGNEHVDAILRVELLRFNL